MEELSYLWAPLFLGILGWVLILEYVQQNIKKKMKTRSSPELLHIPPPPALPSPPGSLPFLGHLHHLLLSRKHLHRWLHDMSTRYGPILSIQMGSVPILLVSSPDMARLVLHTHDLTFASRPHSSTSAAARFTYNHISLSYSLYGPYWRKVKELYMTKLFNMQRLQYFKPIRSEEMAGLVRSVWHEVANPQNMRRKLQVWAGNLMVRMTMGKNLNDISMSTKVHGSVLLEAICESLVIVGSPNLNEFLPFLKFLDVQHLERRTDELFEKIDTIFQRVIDDRRDSCMNIGHHKPENDLLDTLLSFQGDEKISLKDDNVKAILWDMFSGGMETSTVTVEWGLAELMRHKEVTRRLQGELDRVIGKDRLMSEEDISNLPYLQATVKEIMRLHPVGPLLIPHESTKACEVAGFYVPEKTRLLVNIWSLSMDPSSWEEPQEFRPQRFLNSDIDVKGHHFQLLPFGAGRRGCPAINLGLLNVHLILGSLVHSFEWTLPVGIEEVDMSETFGLSLHKTNPLVLAASPRLSKDAYVSPTNH